MSASAKEAARLGLEHVTELLEDELTAAARERIPRRLR
jgi:hypothetical protein